MNETNESSTPTLPYAKGSDTSRAAAKSMENIAPSDEARVIALFEKLGDYGATDKEIEAALGMSHESASARRNGLMMKGKIKDSGRKRLTPSKRKTTVWVLGDSIPVPKGKRSRVKRPSGEAIRAAVAHVREMLTGAESVPEDLATLLLWLDKLGIGAQ